MPRITLETEIDAPIDRCYNLSLSVDLHQQSTARTGERVVAGVQTGIMKQGETVTWRAKHFGISQELTTKIVETREPYFFSDAMIRGAFRSMYHEHHFEERNGKCLMTDHFDFESPFGIFGRIFNTVVLTKYMTRFLQERNRVIKEVAEGNTWKTLVSKTNP